MSDAVISLQAVSDFDRGDFGDTSERFRGRYGRQNPIVTGSKVSKVFPKKYQTHLGDRFLSKKSELVLLSQISEWNLILENSFFYLKENVWKHLVVFWEYFQRCK